MTKYRIKRVTNQVGGEAFFPEFNDGSNGVGGDFKEWNAVPWFEPVCPTQIEAAAAIQRHRDRQTKDEAYIPVE